MENLQQAENQGRVITNNGLLDWSSVKSEDLADVTYKISGFISIDDLSRIFSDVNISFFSGSRIQSTA
jgi:hypothetical protein